MEIDKLTTQAIRDIVAECFPEVELSYCDTIPDESHIYYAFRHVQRWLEKAALEEENELQNNLPSLRGLRAHPLTRRTSVSPVCRPVVQGHPAHVPV